MNKLLCAAVTAWMMSMIAASAGAQGMTMPPGHGSATRPASGPSSQPASEYGRYAPLVADLKLSDEQKAKVKEKVAAYNAAVKEPYEKLMKLHQEFSDAKRAEDFDKAKKAFAALDAQRKKLQELTDKTDFEFLAMLTPEQKIKIHASSFRKMEHMALLMIRPKLTDEQEKKFQEVCEEYGKGVEDLKSPADPKAVEELVKKAHQKFKDLLTPEQKEMLSKLERAATQPSTGHGHGGMGGMTGH